LTGYRSTDIHADVVAWVKGYKKGAWQIDVQGVVDGKISIYFKPKNPAARPGF
jgi:hypothetical protein